MDKTGLQEDGGSAAEPRPESGEADRKTTTTTTLKGEKRGGAWGAQLVKRLPSAQVLIPGSWDRVLHWALCPSPCLCSRSLTEKIFKKKKRKRKKGLYLQVLHKENEIEAATLML